MDLSTKYLGLTLKNPIIVGSCGLTQSVERIKQCEAAGAGAVVMKSLFEEQIRDSDAGLKASSQMHPEVMNYIRADLEMLYGPREYLQTIEQAKKAVSIPVIASINCFTSRWWVDYARQIEAAGADALELNTYLQPLDFSKSAADLEMVYLDIIDSVKKEIKIPVALKLSPGFTSFGNLSQQLALHGANGLVLFNRFVNPDINIEKMETTVKASFYDIQGFYTSLHWVALLSDKIGLDLVASGNIRERDDVIKQILAGAVAVQVVSMLYIEGLKKIGALLDGLQKWMKQKRFKSLDAFRGKLNQINNPQSMAYVRAQYIKKFVGIE